MKKSLILKFFSVHKTVMFWMIFMIIAFFIKQTIRKSDVMISACVTWNGATKRFLMNDEVLKVNSKTNKKTFRKRTFTCHWNYYKQFVIFKPVSYCFEETIGLNIKPHLQVVQGRSRTFHGLKTTSCKEKWMDFHRSCLVQDF